MPRAPSAHTQSKRRCTWQRRTSSGSEGKLCSRRSKSRSHTPRGGPSIASEQRYAIESVDVEQKLGSIIPDVIARIKGRKLLVEITVTHGVDDDKLKKIKELGLSWLEIDLSDVQRDLSRENLEKMIADETTHKRWLHNVRADEGLRKMLSEATLLPSAHRGLADHADGCPVPARVWNGKPYANMIDDCAYCEHRLLISFDIGVICDGFRTLGKPRPPATVVPRTPPEAFEHPEVNRPGFSGD